MQVTDIAIDGNGRETTQHGSFGFPAAVYNSVMSRNVLGYVAWHWHEEIQFCRVTAGTIRFSVGGEEYVCRAGEGVFVNGGRLHMARALGADGAYMCLDVSPRLLGSFPGSVFETRYVTPYLGPSAPDAVGLSPSAEWQREVLDGLLRVNAVEEEGAFGHEFAAAAEMCRMWLLVISNAAAKSSGGANGAAAQAVVEYIGRHYGDRITIGDIARAVNFSPSECCRMFRRATGETIFSYLRAYRLNCAGELLRRTDMPVEAVARGTGFGSASHFIKVFREAMGETPLRYRKSSSVRDAPAPAAGR